MAHEPVIFGRKDNGADILTEKQLLNPYSYFHIKKKKKKTKKKKKQQSRVQVRSVPWKAKKKKQQQKTNKKQMSEHKCYPQPYSDIIN